MVKKLVLWVVCAYLGNATADLEECKYICTTLSEFKSIKEKMVIVSNPDRDFSTKVAHRVLNWRKTIPDAKEDNWYAAGLFVG